MAIFQINLGLPVILKLRMREVVVTTGAMRRAKLQSIQHPAFYRLDALSVTQPTVSEH